PASLAKPTQKHGRGETAPCFASLCSAKRRDGDSNWVGRAHLLSLVARDLPAQIPVAALPSSHSFLPGAPGRGFEPRIPKGTRFPGVRLTTRPSRLICPIGVSN